MNQIVQIENSSLNAKWLNYNQTRLKGNKKTANKILNSFINDLLGESSDIIEKFAYNICQLALDADETLSNNGTEVSNDKNRIQHPLFKKILLPVFVRKYKENEAIYIRWIGQLEQFFYSDNSTTQLFLENINDKLRNATQFDSKTNEYKTINCRYFSTESFFEKSYNIEPNQKTLDLLLKRLAQDIFYATHELPWGILRDADEFIKEIENFKFYFEKSNKQEKWESILNEWTFIGQHWKIYSKEKNKYENFENYLNLNGIENYA
nr:hypothetical protein [uncultured Psychroserpens sp.]